jgi:hypothetical protein
VKLLGFGRHSNSRYVMPGLVPGIHVFKLDVQQDVEDRDDARP